MRDPGGPIDGVVIEVTRGSWVESVHRVRAGLCLPTGSEETCSGDSEPPVYWRSAMKPFQAMPLVEDGAADAFGFGEDELAVCCASHGGQPVHTRTVAGMLRRLGLEEQHLHCGPHPPFDRDAARDLACSGREPGRLHNNCSGKHAGMLALARHHGWTTEGYEDREHPVQTRIRESLAEWLEEVPAEDGWAADGCGIPTPRVGLREMARAYSRLVRRASAGHAAARRVVSAMTNRPQLTSAPGRTPLVIMEAVGGGLLAKEGAEGVLCVASLPGGWGLAIKIDDGSLRATGPAVVQILSAADLLTSDERDSLSSLRTVPIRNTLGDAVGEIRPGTRHASVRGSARP